MKETERVKNAARYQARVIAQIAQKLPRKVDPANGKMWEYRFFPAEDINEFIDWGDSGKAVFKDVDILARTSFES